MYRSRVFRVWILIILLFRFGFFGVWILERRRENGGGETTRGETTRGETPKGETTAGRNADGAKRRRRRRNAYDVSLNQLFFVRTWRAAKKREGFQETQSENQTNSKQQER